MFSYYMYLMLANSFDMYLPVILDFVNASDIVTYALACTFL